MEVRGFFIFISTYLPISRDFLKIILSIIYSIWKMRKETLIFTSEKRFLSSKRWKHQHLEERGRHEIPAHSLGRVNPSHQRRTEPAEGTNAQPETGVLYH